LSVICVSLTSGEARAEVGYIGAARVVVWFGGSVFKVDLRRKGPILAARLNQMRTTEKQSR
jgi:hypothetical protein